MDRKSNEISFWDEQVAGDRSFRRHFYSEVNEYLWKLIMASLGDLRNRRVLFVGCGTSAVAAKEMAQRGAEVWCVDISPESITKLMKHPFGTHREKIHPLVADAEILPLESDSIDVVVGKAIVHHLDIDRFFSELRRVCSPQALVVFSEPLAANPFVKLFRWMTPSARVATEHPLAQADLRHIAKCCENFREYHNFLLALASIPWFLLGLCRAGRFLFRLGCVLDRRFLGLFPPARLLAWNVTLVGCLNTNMKQIGASRIRGRS